MSDSANKRRVAAQRNDRKAAKSERRQQRRHETVLSRLTKRRSCLGSTTSTSFDRVEQSRNRTSSERHDIFVSLGLEDP